MVPLMTVAWPVCACVLRQRFFCGRPRRPWRRNSSRASFNFSAGGGAPAQSGSRAPTRRSNAAHHSAAATSPMLTTLMAPPPWWSAARSSESIRTVATPPCAGRCDTAAGQALLLHGVPGACRDARYPRALGLANKTLLWDFIDWHGATSKLGGVYLCDDLCPVVQLMKN